MVAAVELELKTVFGVSREILDGIGWRKGPRGRAGLKMGYFGVCFFPFPF